MGAHKDGGKDGEKKRCGRMRVSVGGCDTHVTFNDMLPVLPLSSVIHKGLHFPEGRWAATSLEAV